MMEPIRLRRYQERLLRRKKQILSTLRRLEQEAEGASGQKPLNWGSEGWDEQELIDRLNDAHLEELARIDRALGRMLAGTYGLCLACECPVGKWKLELFPETEFCQRCGSSKKKAAKAS